MLYHDFQVAYRDFNDCLKYFNIETNYSLVDLEVNKYLLLKNNPQDKEKINNVYDILYKIKIQEFSRNNTRNELDLYKVNYSYAFKKKYVSFPSIYRDANDLNNSISDVKVLVENHTPQIANCETKEEIDMINATFFANYENFVSKSVLEYAKALNIRNNNRKSEVVNELALNTTSNDSIIKSSLKATFDTFNKELVNSFSGDRYKHIMIGQLNDYFKDIVTFFDNPNYKIMLSTYQEEIDNFIQTQYELFKNKIKEHTIKNEYDVAKYIQGDLKQLQEKVDSFSQSIFKRVNKELLTTIESKISSKDDRADIMRLFSLRGSIKSNNITNFDELSNIYNEVNDVEKIVQFAK